MKQTTIYKTGNFESAHQLKGHPKCGKLHGHSYKYEVWITGSLTGKHNFIIDFYEIKKYFNQYDHSDEIIHSSSEVLVEKAVKYFRCFKNTKNVKVRIWETTSSYAECQSS